MNDDAAIDLDDLDETLGPLEFPASQEEIVSTSGDQTIELGVETRTIERLLDGFEPTNERFESVRDVKQALLTMADVDAVGREGYTDRGGTGGERKRDSF